MFTIGILLNQIGVHLNVRFKILHIIFIFL